MKFDNSYFGEHGHKVALTEDELAYFRSVVDSVQNILGVVIDVRNLDHKWEFFGHDLKAKAPGLFHADDPHRPWENCFITIDNLFIHKCYVANLMGKWRVEEVSLEEVLCHQIAHMSFYRTCKQYRELVNKFVARIRQHMQENRVFLPTYKEFIQMESENQCLIITLQPEDSAEGA